MNLVIPRDLYNLGNLLTNYGHLYIELEKLNLQDKLIHERENDQFNIKHNQDGESYLTNVTLIDKHREPIVLYRPINSRESLSLYFISNLDDEIYNVFNDNRSLNNVLIEELRDE